jgi:glyoxylase-like metal-dependent hydrolase (beta-lactamase superfamily II)
MKRREFLWRSTALAGFAAGSGVESTASHSPQASPASAQSHIQRISEHVGLYRDVVNVAVIRRGNKVLLIGSGSGAILGAAKSLGIKSIDWVLYTDHHRDQCEGALRLKQAGVKIAVPAAEARFFRNATEIWDDADTILYDRMNFRPDLFMLRSSLAPNRELQPGQPFHWEAVDIEVVPTPGPTDGSVSYLVEIDGERLAFTGDLIHSPGQLWNFYMLQKRFPGMRGDYWGFGGAAPELLTSLDTILSHHPTKLVPLHGLVMDHPADAVAELKRNIHAAMANYMTTAAWRIYFTGRFYVAPENLILPDNSHPPPDLDVPMFPPLPLPKAPSWLHHAASTSWYLQADDGTIFLLDCGFYPLLGALARLKKNGTIRGIDAIWITHYHDDHTQSINAVRREYGARLYVQKELQDIFENPYAYSMPALTPESIHVDRPLSEGEVINWKGYKMTGYYFPGQTIFHDGLLIEHEGTRLFMTGDSFADFGIDDYCSYNRNFLGRDAPGYHRCFRLLLELKPDLLVASHWGPQPYSEDIMMRGLKLFEERRALFARLFPWSDPNFGLDPSWVRAYPYRQFILPGQRVTVEARVYNHGVSSCPASAELHAPPGWRIEKAVPVSIPAYTEGKIRLAAIAPKHPPRRREVLGLAVRFGDRDLGEISEAIVDYLE